MAAHLCGWCGKTLAPAPANGELASHGICAQCSAEWDEQAAALQPAAPHLKSYCQRDRRHGLARLIVTTKSGAFVSVEHLCANCRDDAHTDGWRLGFAVTDEPRWPDVVMQRGAA